MGKIQYKTDAFTHTKEDVTITVTGEKMIAVERHGYGLYYTLFGLSNEIATISITSSYGGIDREDQIEFSTRFTLPPNSVLFNDNQLLEFKTKYGKNTVDLFLSECDNLRLALEEKETNYLCVNTNNNGSGVNVYNGTIVATNSSTPAQSGFGTPQTNFYNNSASGKPYSSNDTNENLYNNAPYYYLFSIIELASIYEIYQFSDDVKTIIEDNTIVVPSDNTFVWDVYINAYKSNPLKGGYVTQSVLVRWSCDAVNAATEEYLSKHPDYPYRADNTLIRLSAKKKDASGFSENFYDGLYGDLQTKITIEKLTDVAGVSSLMEQISEFVPSLDVGDVTLYLSQTFQNLALTDTCSVQIPINKAFANVDNLETKNGRHGSVVRLHWGLPDEGVNPEVVGWNEDARDHFNDDVQKYDDDESDIVTDIGANSNISLLTTTYAMTENNLRMFGTKLWSDGFMENIQLINNSPIQNVLSVKSFPFPINGGDSAEVQLGNVKMNVTGNKLPSSFNPIKTIGTFRVPKKYGGHLEWLNWHTMVTAYLPYVGFVELETRQILDKNVTLKYIYDVITGVCTACFYVDGIEISKHSGTIAIDIPITASNRAQVESGLIRSALSAASALVSGNPLAIAGSAFGALTIQNSFITKGSPSPSCDGFDEQNAFIIIDYPVYKEPTNYAHEYGYPCNLSLNLRNCSGFTQLENIDISNIVCTESERAELKQLLESGVYL